MGPQHDTANNSVEILIAEDSPTQAEQLRHILETRGYKVRAAANGRQALAFAHEQIPTLVISDVVMPEMDGYTLCREIKAHEGLKAVPVILVTELSSAEDIIRGLECGADSFVRKPYEGRYLISRIEYALTNRRLGERTKMQLGVEISFSGRKYFITSERQQILDLLISTYEEAVHMNEELRAKQEEIHRAYQLLKTLHRIVTSLNECTTEEQVLEIALERALELPGVQAGWISLREGESGFRVAAARSLHPALQTPSAMEGDCLCRRKLLAGELDHVTNILECERLQKAAGDTRGLRYHASVPLWMMERVVGVMNLAGPHQGIFADQDLEILFGIGNQVAMAIERAHLHEQLENKVEERTRGLQAEIAERKRAEEMLRASEQRYRAIFEGAAEGIFVADIGTLKFRFANPEMCRMLGYTEEELGQMGVNDIHPPEDLERVRAEFLALVRSDKTALATLPLLRRDRTTIYADVKSAKMEIDGRECLVGFFEDISKRKEAEQHLVQMEGRYRGLLEAAPDAMVVVNPGGEIVLLNLQAEKQFGYRRDELVGKHVKSIIPEGFAERLIADALRSAEDALAQQIGTGIELVGRRKDGSDFPIEIMLSPLESAEGILVTAAIRDINERKQAEEALRMSEARLKEAQRIAHVGSWEWESTASQEFWSDELFRIYGLEPQSLQPTRGMFLDIVHPDDRAMMSKAIEDALEKTQPYSVEFRIRRPDGEIRYLHTLGEVFRSPEGKPLRAAGTSRDITEHKLLEKQFIQAQKMEAVGRLAGGIAHDFNNLLTVINGYSQLLLERLDPKNLSRGPIEEIQKAGERATSLTRQLLAFSRKQIVAPQVIELNAIVPDIEKMLRRLIGEDIEFLTVLPPNLGKVKVDKGQIEQVLTNLVVNARDAMPQGGRITIETADVELDAAYVQTHHAVTAGRYVMLAVSDTGHGMDAETQSHIFEPFFTTKEAGKGTGLGLATVYGIVKQSGGYVWVYSEPGEGTVLKIYLPRVEEAQAAEEGRHLSAPATGGNETILVAEDQDAVRVLVCEVLKSKGYEVLEASRGEEALGMAREHEGPIHLLVTDVVMPGMSGRGLARNLVVLRPETKVLYMSGYTDDAIVHHGVLEEGLSFIQKPFSPDALAGKVREALGAAPRAEA